MERESREGGGGSFGRWVGVFPGRGSVFSQGFILPFKRSRRCSAFDAALPAGAQRWAMQAGEDSPSPAVGWDRDSMVSSHSRVSAALKGRSAT